MILFSAGAGAILSALAVGLAFSAWPSFERIKHNAVTQALKRKVFKLNKVFLRELIQHGLHLGLFTGEEHTLLIGL